MARTIMLSRDSVNAVKENMIISQETYDTLIFFKNKIDTFDNSKVWDRAKKLSNDYELIHLPNKRNKKDSIALHDPLSRSYFKMWEMIQEFTLFDTQNNSPVTILCLAEGPGGFIEAINNYRKPIQDVIYGITLKSNHKDIPGWRKSHNFLRDNPNIIITYGADATGNIYKLDNIKYLSDTVKKAYLITADGGFDFSGDFNNQEKLSYRIVFCEIVSALTTQQINGHFGCKIFDIHSIVTVRLLYILSFYYETVFITKPLTSRPANSEKYIICKKFKGISPKDLYHYFNIITYWCDIPDETLLLNNIIVPPYFIKQIYDYNEYITHKQIENIKKTLDIIENEENLTTIAKIVEIQKENALSWCDNYNVEINTTSSYLSK